MANGFSKVYLWVGLIVVVASISTIVFLGWTGEFNLFPRDESPKTGNLESTREIEKVTAPLAPGIEPGRGEIVEEKVAPGGNLGGTQ